MKISELIKRLEDIKNKDGDMDVTISCEPENYEDGSPEDENICIITWELEPKHLMLCDSWTASEICSGSDEETP